MSGVILASRSLARANLLAAAGLIFTVQPADVDEGALKDDALVRGVKPLAVAQELALAKARAIRAPPGTLVLGADQTLELDGRLLDKPPTLVHARGQLRALRGRSHRLHSAVACLEDSRAPWSFVGSVTLHVRDFSDAFLESYLVAEGEFLMGCVGGYRLEGLGAQLFTEIEGDYFTVLGLPLLPLLGYLRACSRLDA